MLETENVEYVECHATGDLIADAQEVNAITVALETGTESPLLIGSLKSNCGHLGAASGTSIIDPIIPSHKIGHRQMVQTQIRPRNSEIFACNKWLFLFKNKRNDKIKINKIRHALIDKRAHLKRISKK